MVDLSWVKCPKCGESGDLVRQGPALNIGTKRKRGAVPAWKATVLTTSVCSAVRCGFCGHVFNTTQPTRRESFGYDGINDVPF